jgi:hypothetical protein
MIFEQIDTAVCRDYPDARVSIRWATWDSGATELAVRFAWPDRNGRLTQTATIPAYAHTQLHEMMLHSGSLRLAIA